MPDKYRKITIKQDGVDIEAVERTSDKVEILNIRELQTEKDHLTTKIARLNERLVEIDKALK